MMIFPNFLLCFLIARDVMVGICVVWWYFAGGAKTPREWCEICKKCCCGGRHRGWSALLPWPWWTYDWSLQLWEFASRTYHHPNSSPNQNCNDEKTTGGGSSITIIPHLNRPPFLAKAWQLQKYFCALVGFPQVFVDLIWIEEVGQQQMPTKVKS